MRKLQTSRQVITLSDWSDLIFWELQTNKRSSSCIMCTVTVIGMHQKLVCRAGLQELYFELNEGHLAGRCSHCGMGWRGMGSCHWRHLSPAEQRQLLHCSGEINVRYEYHDDQLNLMCIWLGINYLKRKSFLLLCELLRNIWLVLHCKSFCFQVLLTLWHSQSKLSSYKESHGTMNLQAAKHGLH